MKTKIILFSLLLMSATVNSQNNFLKGYIITNQLDTIHGLVDLRMDDKNAYQCIFKQGQGELAITYSPGEIYGFRFDEIGKYYVSRKISIDEEEQEVFLEFLIKGEMNLYYYLYKNKEYFFFENQEGKMLAISKKDDYLILRENHFGQEGRYIVEDNLYKGRLYLVFEGQTPVMKQDIDQASFDRGNMIELTKKYHSLTCTSDEPCIQFENDYKRNFGEFHFAVYGGVSHITYIPNMVNLEDRFRFKNATSFFPALGFQLGFSKQRLLKSFSFQMDLAVAKLNFNDSYERKIQHPAFTQATFEHTMSAWMFSGKLGLRYTYPEGSFRPFAEAGFCMIYLYDLSNVYNITLAQDYTRIVAQDFFRGFYGGMGVNYSVNKKHFITTSLSYEEVRAAFRAGYIRNSLDQMKNMLFKIGYMF